MNAIASWVRWVITTLRRRRAAAVKLDAAVAAKRKELGYGG